MGAAHRRSRSKCRSISPCRRPRANWSPISKSREFRAFAEAVSRTEYGFDYVVIDTAGHNTYLMRVSHAMADTLITPINDSFVDFDVLGRVDPETLEVLGPSHYAELCRNRCASAA